MLISCAQKTGASCYISVARISISYLAEVLEEEPRGSNPQPSQQLKHCSLWPLDLRVQRAEISAGTQTKQSCDRLIRMHNKKIL